MAEGCVYAGKSVEGGYGAVLDYLVEDFDGEVWRRRGGHFCAFCFWLCWWLSWRIEVGIHGRIEVLSMVFRL